MKASLIPVDGGDPIVLVKEITIVGRKESCDVQINEPSISKVHLLLAKTDGLLLFRDMASTNGTKVNGQRVVRGALLPNDKIQIAAAKYQVQLLPDEPVAQAEASEAEPASAGDEPVVRVFRAQELARPDRSRKQPDAAAVDTAEDDEQKVDDADRSARATPPRHPNADAAGPAEQFVD